MDGDMDMGDEGPEERLRGKLGKPGKPDLDDVDPDEPEPDLDDDDEEEVDVDDEIDDEDGEEEDLDVDVKKKPPMDKPPMDKPPMDKPPMFSKKKSKKSKKKMKKEQAEFFKSLSAQMGGGNTNAKYWDGISEDAVFNPPEPNQGLADMEPQAPENPGPGDLGYSPVTRIQG
jgi:hypothetical protein